MQEPEETYLVHAGPGLADTGTRVLKHGDTFLVSEPHGDVVGRGLSQLGLFHDGTRHLSYLMLRIESVRPLLLGSSVTADNVLLVVSMMNPDITAGDRVVLEHGRVHVRRERLLWSGEMHERITVSSFAREPCEIVLSIDTRADFVDLFEVRGTPREKRGTLHDPDVTSDSTVVWRYDGLDGKQRSTHVRFDPVPSTLRNNRASFTLRLEPGASASVELGVKCFAEAPASEPLDPEERRAFDVALDCARDELAAHVHDDCDIASSNDLFDAWIERSQADLRMMVTETPMGRYPYAGVPWFSTPFGRDGILTALEVLWMNPTLAAGVLEYLAAHQARGVDERADAEPGKILHETRGGEMAALREVPFGKYYGSVDSTPLFVLLAARYHEATADDALLDRIWPAVSRALEWIDRSGDRDGDGFVEYGRKTPQGLLQQGWKDAGDSVFHADGGDAEGPIALAEVQGYVYAAKREIAVLVERRGDAKLAAKLRSDADALREQFDRAFWCDDIGTYALALDGQKRPCKVRTSNAGHCLWSEIAFPERAAIVADQLLSPEMFSGWGVRTVGRGEARYNPMSYHNGSIWPHDNALVGEGLARYGLTDHVARIFTSLFELSVHVDLHRLPELFCGFPRQPGEGPTLYPVACAPQAWAAGAAFMLLGATLGLRIDARKQSLTLSRPTLPPWLERLHLRGVRVGEAELDLSVHRYPGDVALTVDRRSSSVSVAVLK